MTSAAVPPPPGRGRRSRPRFAARAGPRASTGMRPPWCPGVGVTPTCGAAAASCSCHLVTGHDGPHECELGGCGGSWYGVPGDDDFQPVCLPAIGLTLDTFERHVDDAFAACGFPRLVEPAPQSDPALRGASCGCECNTSGWCGGCGHAGCGGRMS